MTSIDIRYHKRDMLPCNPASGDDVIRYGSDNRMNHFSSSNSIVLNNSSVGSGSLLLHDPCLTMTNLSGCDQSPMLHICPVSYPPVGTHRHLSVQAHRHLSVQVSGSTHLTQPSFGASYTSSMMPSISHLSEQCRYTQLFIKSIRNTTISIHIDATASIYHLKHLIYAHDGIPPCDLRLMRHGRELRDDALLSGLDVDGGSITCLLRVLGGITRTHKLPIYWWFGFSRSYEDGRAGEEGRTCHVLSEFEFEGGGFDNWCSGAPLSSWVGICLHPGIVFFYCVDIFRCDVKNF